MQARWCRTSSRSYRCGSFKGTPCARDPTTPPTPKVQLESRFVECSMHTCASGREGNEMEKEYISGDIENVEHYLGELFQVPVGVCIADTNDVVLGALGYEISDLRREPDPDCVTAFQYVARIE